MTNPSLWIRFTNESIPLENLDEDDIRRLEILWRKALQEIGFIVSLSPEHLFFRRRKNTPYLNFSLLVHVLSKNALRVTASEKGEGRSIRANSGRLMGFISLLVIHWRVEAYLSNFAHASTARSDNHDEIEKKRVQSLALGICQQLLMMRLPHHTQENLAAWLMTPEQAPHFARRTLKQLLKLQQARDLRSHAWRGFFKTDPDSCETPLVSGQPESLWSDDPTKLNSTTTHRDQEECAPLPQSSAWKGLPVCSGIIEGSFWLVPERIKSDMPPPTDATIFIFRYARPQSVELYARTRAVLFIEGGVLSHACCVAREKQMICMTGLGQRFLSALLASPQKHLRVEVSSENGSAQVTIL